jgi:hypothetical protein
MLGELLGSHTAAKIFVHLFHHGETYAAAVSQDMAVAMGPVQRQLDRYENLGLIVSKKQGRTRVYTFNMKSPMTGPFKELVRIVYENIPLAERENLFNVRRRARRRGKPVIGRRAA